jgi:hypothetical protein
MSFITKASSSSSGAESKHLLRVATAAAVGGQNSGTQQHKRHLLPPRLSLESLQGGWLHCLTPTPHKFCREGGRENKTTVAKLGPACCQNGYIVLKAKHNISHGLLQLQLKLAFTNRDKLQHVKKEGLVQFIRAWLMQKLVTFECNGHWPTQIKPCPHWALKTS